MTQAPTSTDASGAEASGTDGTDTSTVETSDLDTGRPHSWSRPRRWRRTVPAIVTLLAIVGLGLFLMLEPGADAPDDQPPESGSGTAVAEVTRQTLEARTEVDGTLEYDASTGVTTPVGTAADALEQAQATVASATTTLVGDRLAVRDTASSGALSVDSASAQVATARRALAAASSAQSASCAGASSAECAAAKQEVRTARGQLAQDRAALASARAQAVAANHQANARVDADQAALAAANATLARARRTATNPGVTITWTAEVGDTVRRGQRLYSVDGASVPLFYGAITPWRALYRGVAAGPDVASLNTNLAALGYDGSLAGSRSFTTATERAVKAWQRDMRAVQDGVVALGDVVYRTGPVIVTDVTADTGQATQPGGLVMTTSSTTRVVTVPLDTDRQGQVHVGDEVTITLPDGATTPGTVTEVGTVATSASDATDGDGSSGAAPGSSDDEATIEVRIKLRRPDDIGHLDQAPVQVAITSARQRNALVVPLAALLARPGGSYAVEVIHDDGTHALVEVKLGLVDDANSRVAVEGAGLDEGQQIVVPQS